MDIREDRKHAGMYIEIGYNITYYRKHRNLTQEQLAEMVGISRQHLGAIEAPKIVRAISLDVLFDISIALGIRPDKLLIDRSAADHYVPTWPTRAVQKENVPDTARSRRRGRGKN